MFLTTLCCFTAAYISSLKYILPVLLGHKDIKLLAWTEEPELTVDEVKEPISI
jgi:hypothetical protein